MNVLSKIDLITKYGDIDYDLDYYTELPDLSLMLYGVDRALQSPTEDEEDEEDDDEKENLSKMNRTNDHENKPHDHENKPHDHENKPHDHEPHNHETNTGDASSHSSEADFDASDVCDEEEFVRSARTPFQRKYRKLYWMLCEIVNDYSLLSFLPLDINVCLEGRDDDRRVPRVFGKSWKLQIKRTGFRCCRIWGMIMRRRMCMRRTTRKLGKWLKVRNGVLSNVEMNNKYVLRDDDWI